MSGTRAELATQALVAHSPVVLVTRVEESSNPANIVSNAWVHCVATQIETHLTFFYVFKKIQIQRIQNSATTIVHVKFFNCKFQ